jgi:hypothetical protein
MSAIKIIRFTTFSPVPSLRIGHTSGEGLQVYNVCILSDRRKSQRQAISAAIFASMLLILRDGTTFFRNLLYS